MYYKNILNEKYSGLIPMAKARGFRPEAFGDSLNKDDEYNIPYGFVERIDAKANVNDMTLTLTYPLSKKDGVWKVKECNNPLSVLNLATMVLLTP